MAQCSLGGRDRELKYPWKAIRKLKTTHDINLLSPTLDESLFTDPQTVTALVWAACLHESPNLTMDEVDGWLSFNRLGTVAEAVASAIQEALMPPSDSSTAT